MSAIDSCYKTWIYNPMHPVELHIAFGSCAIARVPASNCQKALHHRIVPAIPSTTHTAFKTMNLQQLPEGFAGVLRTTIRVLVAWRVLEA